MKTTAIILAGGKGKRMGSNISKQYLLLNKKPILYYTIKAFEESKVDNIIIVASIDEQDYCQREIIDKYNFTKVNMIVSGGKERYNSVYEGLKAIEESKIDTNIVLIHDGARPFVTTDIINASIICASNHKACVAAVKSKDTIKIADEEGFIDATPDRNKVWQIQTPQTFEYDLIKEAYDVILKGDTCHITDDAMVLEAYGFDKIKLLESSYDNIKITTSEDLIFGEGILKNRVAKEPEK